LDWTAWVALVQDDPRWMALTFISNGCPLAGDGTIVPWSRASADFK
jgi:hypothetical protein